MAPRRSVAGEGSLVVTQVRSAIGGKPKHRATLRALGLSKIGGSRVVEDRPEIRGMLSKVAHLVEVRASTKKAPKPAHTDATKEAE
jgi:large subunit ribosomal protein L30